MLFQNIKIKEKITISAFLTGFSLMGLLLYFFYRYVAGNLHLSDVHVPFTDQQLLWVPLAVAFFSVLVITAVGYVVGCMIANPIKELSNTARSVAGGDFTRRASIHSRDEIGQLATSFNVMTDTLSRMTEEAKAIIHVLPEPLFILDKRGRVTLANKSACNSIGFENDEDIIGRSIKDFLIPDSPIDSDDKNLTHNKDQRK